MQSSILKLRPATFGLAIFCFILPFVTMSCPGGQYTFSGLQLVTGTTVGDQKLPAEPLAGLALLCATVGLLLAFLKQREIDLLALGASVGGAVLLVVLRAKLLNDALKQGGVVQLTFDFGYWLAALAFAVATALCILQWQEDKARKRAVGQDETVPAP